MSVLYELCTICDLNPVENTFVSFFDPQYLQDLDEEVAEMTRKKQRDCEVGLVIFPLLVLKHMAPPTAQFC